MATDPWPGFDAIRQRLHGLVDPDASPLVEDWERIIQEGNRRGVLQGVDGFGQPMPALRYRNGFGNPNKQNRKGRGFGKAAKESRYDNLTTAEYRRLTGPRLAPRRLQSRVIRNLETGHGRDPGNRFQWFAVGAWDNVVNAKGEKFLMAHFAPRPGSRLPRYDLRPVRPEDRRLARQKCREWARELIRKAAGK